MTSAEGLFSALVERGATHAVGLPDSVTAPVIERFEASPSHTWIPVTREGEAFSLATGLWVGGATPVVIVQNTGLLESGDAIRGVAQRAAAPIVALVTYRGWGTMEAAGWTPGDPFEGEAMIDPSLDTTAVLTEPTLRAWGIEHRIFREAGDLDAVWSIAQSTQRPAVLLLNSRLSG